MADINVTNLTAAIQLTTQNSTSQLWTVIPEFIPTLITMTTVIVTLGLVSNLLLIASIWRAPKLHTVANSFVVFMCVIDLCRIVHILAFDLVSGISGRWQYNKRGACTFSAFILNYAGKATGLSFCLISINRVVMITCHKMYRKVFHSRSSAMILIFVVLASMALTLPMTIDYFNIQILYSDHTGSCYAYDNDPNKVFQILSIFVTVILPSVVMIPSYTWIYYFVRQSKRRVTAHVNARARQNVCHREELRSAIIIFLTYITYCLFYVPLYSSYVAFVLGVNIPSEVLVISNYLTDFHRFIRPCLYPSLGNAYREALFNLFKKNTNSPVTGLVVSLGGSQTNERVEMNARHLT